MYIVGNMQCLILYTSCIVGNPKQAGVATASVAVKGSGSSSAQASAGSPLVLVCAVTSPSLLVFALEVFFLSCVCIYFT